MQETSQQGQVYDSNCQSQQHAYLYPVADLKFFQKNLGMQAVFPRLPFPPSAAWSRGYSELNGSETMAS